jgi:hypothetical protein
MSAITPCNPTIDQEVDKTATDTESICKDAHERMNKEIKMLYEYSKHDDNQYFNTLAACSCCERHTENKPANMKAGWIETACHYSHAEDYAIYCACECRHKMRIMARFYNKRHNYCYPSQ